MPADGKIATAAIVDLTHDGEGVADLGGQRAFVPDALPGERPPRADQRARAPVVGRGHHLVPLERRGVDARAHGRRPARLGGGEERGLGQPIGGI